MIHHVYANQSNVGDWLSARGIQSLLRGRTVREHFCDEPFAPATLTALASVTSDDLIVIGGGGLFMDYFASFWTGFRSIAHRVPFVIWGVGACDLKRECSRLPSALLIEIIRLSRLCVVRDELTRELLSDADLSPPVACPAIAALAPSDGETRLLLHVDHYNSVGPENFERMTAAASTFAAETVRACRKTNNLIDRGNAAQLRRVVDLYVAADLVLSSRLHGCILALALGRRVLAVSGDRKVDAFMRSAGLEEWVVDLSAIECLPEKLAALPTQSVPRGFVAEQRRKNAAVAAVVNAMLAEQELRFAT